MMVAIVVLGGALGGSSGAVIGLLFGAGGQLFAYFLGSSSLIKSLKAHEINHSSNPRIFTIVEELTQKMSLPMPKVFVVPDPTPNAFATGRNKNHSAVAITQGLLDMLDEREIRAVVAHELGHIEHRDILIGTIAAILAGAFVTMTYFFSFFGGNNEDRPNPIMLIAVSLLAPLGAKIIQMSISREREYMADETSARVTNDPYALINALTKIEANAIRPIANAKPQTAHMYIINPFAGLDLGSVFKNFLSTHPSTKDRVKRLEEISYEL